MSILNYKSQYNKNPIIDMKTSHKNIYDGVFEIVETLSKFKKGVLVFETYPGTDLNILHTHIVKQLSPKAIVDIEEFSKTEADIDDMIQDNLTDDRVFGFLSEHEIKDFYQLDKIEFIQQQIEKIDGLVVVYGFGASLIKADMIVFVGLTRWEIQLRYRKGLCNFKKNNPDEDILRKYKRGYFVEWRVANRIKESIIDNMNYYLDFTDLSHPVMIDQMTYHEALDQLIHQPFRMVPYFDPGIWGGQWMKEVCNLDRNQSNFAWSFDGVPEENSIKLKFNDKIIEIPAQDVVQFRPIELMGKKVYQRFGKNFPIRFDLLDTMGGGNLSLQVHPMTQYIQDQFGMDYTQDESYYILDAKPNASVYLGFKENIDKNQFQEELTKASLGDASFDALKYVNQFPAKKHDHFLIPAGTIHCSGKNTMVLEISACVYIFTFKLWDWGRLGLDGQPRPVHLEHGFNNLQYNRDTKFAKEQLINTIRPLNEHEEYTGLHELEFLETRRFKFNDFVDIDTYDSVNMANLVEGKSAVIQSLDGTFQDYKIHYAETFVVPSTIKKFRIKCLDEQECIIIKAHVR